MGDDRAVAERSRTAAGIDPETVPVPVVGVDLVGGLHYR